MRTTSEVLDHHLKSFGEGNLDGILSDYTPESILMTADATLVGVDAIRPVFAALVEEFSGPGVSFEMSHQSTKSDNALIVWSAETADNVYEFATDTFVIRNGKIVAQTFAAKIHSKG